MTAKETLKTYVQKALADAFETGTIPADAALPPIMFEIPKLETHGDYSSNIAMVLAPLLKKKPRDIAGSIVAALNDTSSIVKDVSIAGPGFINFFLNDRFWFDQLKEIISIGPEFGKNNFGGGQKVQVEFVSANPTGPLHIGHGRGAALGDSFAKILAHSGFQVTTEYYINDMGNQMATLGRSVLYRYYELLDKTAAFPDNHYQGDYIYDIARDAVSRWGDQYLNADENETIPTFTALAKDTILAEIREDLEQFAVSFDNWFSEKSLVEDGTVDGAIAGLKKNQYIYEHEGAQWFKTSAFGDEKDRVVVRDNGLKTYFASDIAYHKNKFSRGFERVIDIWGADHHGYVPRIKAVLQALNIDPDKLNVVLVQMVSLLRDGVPLSMSTRSGTFVTLREVVEEVGSDAARYIFLTRRADSPLDFDLEVAKKQSDENPVYYVQYAHARLCSILRVAAERGVNTADLQTADLSLLALPEELTLIKRISHFPDIIETSAQFLEPHRITIFLQDLVSTFHRYYHLGKLDSDKRVISDNEQQTRARLSLVDALRITISNALSLLGVSAPDHM